MIRAAEAIHDAGVAKRFPGLSGMGQVDDWAAVIDGKDALVGGLRQKKYTDLLPGYEKITYIDEGAARLVEGGVEVGERMIRAPRVIIATGGHPALPPIPGITNVPALDSTSLLALETLPDSLIFLGGGYIGAELAQMRHPGGVRQNTLLPLDAPLMIDLLPVWWTLR